MESLTSGTLAGTFGDPVRPPGADDGAARRALLAAAQADLAEPGRYLLFTEGDDARAVSLDAERTRIGRALTAEVRLDDPTISRRHALITCDDGGVRVLDDRSLNGVYVNGNRIEQHTLADGDEIGVGRYRMRFLVLTPEAIAARPLLQPAS